jgi:serine-type D-Ala-D-Ala carboxypeptidase (penicillin-binding protein 5/6)
MSPSFIRLVALFLLTAALCTGLVSVAPARPVTAMEPAQLRPGPLPDPGEPTAQVLRNLVRPAPSSSPSPSPTPSVSRTAAPRPRPTIKPIPVPSVDAQEIALYNLDTGRFLWQSNARAAWAPASLTKIVTAMVAVDLMGLNATVTVPASISQLPADSTFMGLSPGEQLTVRDLLYGVFLPSGNDAAETLATATTSRASFIAAMNAKAVRLGLRTTHFVNPTGLDGAGHYSTAADLTTASAYLEAHYPGLVGIAATPSITIAATSTHKAYKLVNLNKLLTTYPGTYGLKTGWTEAALGCLITTSKRGGHRLLAVMLGAPNGTAYAQMPKVLDYGFELLGVLPRPAG